MNDNDSGGNQQIASPLDHRPDGRAPSWACTVYNSVYKLGDSDGENAADMDGCDCDAKYWMDREIGGWRTTTSKQPPQEIPMRFELAALEDGGLYSGLLFCCI